MLRVAWAHKMVAGWEQEGEKDKLAATPEEEDTNGERWVWGGG